MFMNINYIEFFRHKLRSARVLVRRFQEMHSPSYIQTVLNQTVDIRLIPKARGKLRALQLLDVKLLKIVHDFCVRNEIRYCLAYGTLLGVQRHNDFVPWDDDIDIYILKEDYARFRDLLQKEMAGTDFCLYGIENCRLEDTTLRISHKMMPNLNVDIFYLHPVSIDREGFKAITKCARKVKKHYMFDYRYRIMGKENKERLDAFRQAYDTEYDKAVGGCDFSVAKGFVADVSCTWHYFPKSVMFPFKLTNWMGHDFYVPADPVGYLESQYGDWLSFPPRFDHHGDQFMSFTNEQAEKMEAHLDKCVAQGKFL